MDNRQVCCMAGGEKPLMRASVLALIIAALTSAAQASPSRFGLHCVYEEKTDDYPATSGPVKRTTRTFEIDLARKLVCADRGCWTIAGIFPDRLVLEDEPVAPGPDQITHHIAIDRSNGHFHEFLAIPTDASSTTSDGECAVAPYAAPKATRF